MMTHRKGRNRLRISDQDALLKWCRSNGFSLTRRDLASELMFDINRRGKSGDAGQVADFVLTASEHMFSIRDADDRQIAQHAQLREVLKQISGHLAGAHSAAS
ncbi:hypothetical protein [Pelagibius sp. Alg239-R121]|uniref:hypothetical protein n=1 Tax=Pelagibius sp. Alg239-R121 TaxID=2993448 RepID=UPI0024A657E0|nr:hypothetical protein [Pelagibius sp. Alg239-R121]